MAENERQVAEKVRHLQLVWEQRYMEWIASKERSDQALQNYHNAFQALLWAKVEAAKAEHSDGGGCPANADGKCRPDYHNGVCFDCGAPAGPAHRDGPECGS